MKILQGGSHGRRYMSILIVWVNGANKEKRDALVPTDLIKGCLVSNMLGGFKRRRI
jgi:hypothetical protein